MSLSRVGRRRRGVGSGAASFATHAPAREGRRPLVESSPSSPAGLASAENGELGIDAGRNPLGCDACRRTRPGPRTAARRTTRPHGEQFLAPRRPKRATPPARLGAPRGARGGHKHAPGAGFGRLVRRC
eukprot:202726-Chlamydomonas_euryale.AAC.3